MIKQGLMVVSYNKQLTLVNSRHVDSHFSEKAPFFSFLIFGFYFSIFLRVHSIYVCI